jgi:hypothetical protein
MHIGRMAEVLGVVFDPEYDDLIIIGSVTPGVLGPSLDDLVVALRARLQHREWPLVSIDKTPDTKDTGMQVVRLEGGIDHTRFARDLLDVDVVLKKLALGNMSAEIWGVHSYFDGAVERARAEKKVRDMGTRFWFYPLECSVVVREGVGIIRRLEIGVRKDVYLARIEGETESETAELTNSVADLFASSVNNAYEDLAVAHHEIARLKILLNLVALAHSVELLDTKPNLDYWLSEYSVPRVETPSEYPLLKREAPVQDVGMLTVDGGIQLQALQERLEEDGDITALRDAVLMSRPENHPLVWRLPFDDWEIPGCSGSSELANLPPLATPIPPARDIGCCVGEQLRFSELPTALDMAGSSFDGEYRAAVQPQVNVGARLMAESLSPDIGGVMLSGIATVDGVDKPQVDLSGGNFSLVVDGKNARLDPKMFRKFITALWCVYYGDQDPGISIDPPWGDSEEAEDPEKWSKDEKHSVRYIGRVFNTDLGRVMREADYLMKKWAVGTEQPNHPDFFSVDRYEATLGVGHKGVPTRFWFVPQDICFKRGGDLLLFDRGRIQLNTEHDRDGLRGKAGAADEKFAEVFTQHYGAIAKNNPVFQELFEYAKLVSLAKYLKQESVPLYWFLLAHKDLVLMEDSPLEVDGLLNHSQYVRGLMVKGGVNLSATPSYEPDTRMESVVAEALARLTPTSVRITGMGAANGSVRRVPTSFSFDLDSQSYSVLPQHTLTSGKDHRGNRYQTDLALRQNGRPGLELVRYYNPRNRNGGEFGKGWHLLIPYRIRPAGEEKTEFLNAIIPAQMAVENLCTGEQEVLSFREDGEHGAGYIPKSPPSSQVVRLLLMSDASYRLIDKLGNQFHFDQRGNLTDMFFSPNRAHHVHVEYLNGLSDKFERDPYLVQAAGDDRVAFRNLRLPRRIKVNDLVHGKSELLTFSEVTPIVGYVPENEAMSDFRLVALLTNTGLQLVDKHGNEVVFDSNWKFKEMLPSPSRPMVQSISVGSQTATFGYKIGLEGELIIASAALVQDGREAEPSRVVHYEHDSEGRLCHVRHSAETSP